MVKLSGNDLRIILSEMCKDGYQDIILADEYTICASYHGHRKVFQFERRMVQTNNRVEQNVLVYIHCNK